MAEEDVLMIQPGEVLRGRWEVKKKLGGGGFGQIYIAFDSKIGVNVAIKTEARAPKGKDGRPDPNHVEVLSMEHKVLAELDGQAHFCKVWGCGQDPTYNFLVMTLCGANLTDLRHDSPQQYFSFGTACCLTIQCIESVQFLHNIGYLHRDIKPSNFAMGREVEDARMVYMVDFGLARMYIKWVIGPDGTRQAQIRREREKVGFRGTVRYASIAIHENREMGRVDDLWSVYYMLIEMAVGKVPWRLENEKNKVRDIKKQIPPKALAHGMPKGIVEMIDHMDTLAYADAPNYNYMMDRLRNALRAWHAKPEDPYDWENNWVNCKEKCPFKSPSL